MRYLVVRRGPRAARASFTELVSAGADLADVAPTIGTADLRATEAADIERDPDVDALVLSLPFTLLKPVAEDVPDAVEPVWGLDAVGATTCASTGKGVTVAVLDTGVDTAHDAFAGRSFAARDLVDFTAVGAPVDRLEGIPGAAADDDGHGTHVAATLCGGTIGARRVGVAPGVARALVGKVIGRDGAGTEAIYAGLTWAMRERADVVCLSLGIDFPGGIARIMEQDDLPQDVAASRAFEAFRRTVRLFDQQMALAQALAQRGRGTLVVAATGNQSRRHEDPRFTVDAGTPAVTDGVIAVGAIGGTAGTPPYRVSSFSNTGCRLVGPGERILSARRGGGAIAMSGTSMAAPHVAGVAALWIEHLFAGRRPPAWPRDVLGRLESAAVNPGGWSRRDVGLGLVQAPATSGAGA